MSRDSFRIRAVEELEIRLVPTLLGQELFPADNPWNQNIANAPVAANSAAVISHSGTNTKVHLDFGYEDPSYGNAMYGIPVNVVHGDTAPKVNVIIDQYASDSDIVPVPMPSNPVIEGDYQDGPNPNGPGYNTGERGDSHLIIWDEDNNVAYEFFLATRPSDPVDPEGNAHTDGKWEAASETVWDMKTNTFRTLGETSADAAGLSILAGLARPDEGLPVSKGGQGAIDHALRFTMPKTDISNQYIYPASHEADSSGTDKMPMGSRLRLKDNPTIDAMIAKMGPEAQIVAKAMQQYGLILADNGSPMFITGTARSVDSNNTPTLVWDWNDVSALQKLTMSDFDLVDLTPVVTGLSASSGSSGSTITVTGQNFSGAAGHLSVFFGPTAATSVTYVSDTQLTVVVPNGTGTVDVTVQSGVNVGNNSQNATSPIFGYGISATSAADQFTWTASSPVSGSKSSVSFASPTDASSTTDLVTIVVEDASGAPVTGLASSAFALSLAGGGSTGSFGTVTETATPGTYTTQFTGAISGTASTLSTTVSGVSLTTKPTVTVTPGAISASKSNVSFASATDAIGSTDLVTIIVEDAVGNAISKLTNDDFVFALSGGTSNGSFGTVTETATPGTYTANFTGSTVGTAATLTLTVSGTALAAHPTVQVTSLPVSGSNSTISFAAPTDVSGTTDLVTIVVKDTGNNPVTGLASSAFSFTLAGASTGSFGTVTETATPGTYTTQFTGILAGAAATLTTKVNGVTLTTKPTVQVTAGAVSGSKSTVSFASSTDVSGATDLTTIVVEDAAGNPITGLTSSAFTLTLSGGSTGSFGTVTESATPGTYTTQFTGSLAGAAATLTTKVNSVSLTTKPTVQVTAGAVSGSKSTVSFASSTDVSGATDLTTIVVEDAAGNPITGLASSAFTLTLSGGSTGSFGTVTETATHGTYTTQFTGSLVGAAATLTTKVNSVSLTAQPTVQVTAGAVSGSKSTVHFASSTDVSGTTDLTTIVVEDAAGNPITGLASSAFTLTLAGGGSTGSFGTVTETATHGTYTTQFTGTTAGTASTLSTQISSVSLTTTKPTVQVTAGAVSGSKSTVSFASSTDVSGTTDLTTIVVEDAAGNPITGLASSAFTLTLSGGSSTGSFGTVTETATHGTYTAQFTGTTAGTASTLSTKVNSVALTAQPTVQVTSGSVSGSKSTVSFASPTDVSGATDLVTIVVKDSGNNPVTGLASSAFSFTLTGASTGSFGVVTETATPGTYTAQFTGNLAGAAATLTTKVSGVSLTTQPTVQVTAGAVSGSKSTVSFASSTDVSGTTDLTTIVVEDAAGNAITGLASGAFTLTLAGGGSTGSFGTVTETATPGTYTAQFTGSLAGAAATLSTKVNSVSLTAQPKVQVTAGAVSGSKSTVSFASPTDVSGSTDLTTIVVEDAAGNPITGLVSGAFTLTLAGGGSTGSFGTVTETGTPGTYTTQFTGNLAGTASTLSTKVNGVSLSTKPTVQVAAGAISGSKSTVSFASPTIVLDSTDLTTIVVEDAAGNAITGLTNSAFSLALSGGGSSGSFGTVTETATPGTYTALFTGSATGTASTLSTQVSGVSLTTRPTIQVTSLPLSGSNSTVSFAASTDASGTTDLVTILVKDTGNNPVTGLASTAFALNLAGGTSTGSFGTVTETATPGTYTTQFTGVLAGTAATLSTTASGVSLTTKPTVTVTPGAISASKSTVSFASPTDALGSTDLVTIVVEDAAGNAISKLTNNEFSFALSGGTSNGSFGAVTETATPGTYTANFTGSTVGTAATLTQTVNGTSLTARPTIQVTALPVSGSNSTVSFASSTDASGTIDLVTIVVKDTGNNPVTGLASGAFTLTLAGGGSTGSFGAVTETATPGTYTAQFTGITAGAAATLSTQVSGVSLSTKPTVQVTAGAVSGSKSTVSFASPMDASGATDLTTIVVEDAAGNPVSGLSSGAFTLTLSGGGSTGSFGAVTETATHGTYTAQFTGITAGAAATLSTKVNGVALTAQPTVQVTSGSVSGSNSTVHFASSTDVSGATDLVTIVVKDSGNNPVTGLASGAFSFTLAGGGSTGSFGAVTETATPGTYTAQFTGNLAGAAATLATKVSGVSLTNKPTVQVTPGSISGSRSTVSFASSTDLTGTTDLTTIAVKDAAGNAITGLANSAFTLTLAGGGSTGSFGAVTETATPGTYTTLFTGADAGTPSTLSTKISGVSLTAKPTVQVTDNSISGSNSTASFASSTDPMLTSDLLTIVVKDAGGNAVTGLPNTAFDVTLSSGTSNGHFGAVVETAVPGTYTTEFTGTQVGTPSAASIAVNGVLLTAQPSVEVTSAPVHSGYPVILVGVGPGVPSSVNLYSTSGTLIDTFNPFPGFEGGVRVAVGDFNGDGSVDYAFGTGPGMPAEVKVIDGASGAVLLDVKPFDDFSGGVFVAAGAIAGDGTDSLVITPDQGGGPRVEVFQDQSGNFTRTNNFFALENPFFRGGARATVGDINGDGFADVIVAAGFGGGPVVEVYDGQTLDRAHQQSILIPDFYAFDPSLRNGAYVAMGDVDGDGFGDLIIGAGPGGGPRVLVLSGAMLLNHGADAAADHPIANFFDSDADNRGGVRVAVADIDGDGHADVLTGSGEGGGSQVTAYLGAALASGVDTPAGNFDAFPGYMGGVFVG